MLLVCGIGVNALFLQSDRHPAPFFRSAKAVDAEVQQAAAVPLPPARPAETAQRAQPKPSVQAAPPAPVPSAERVAAPAVDQRATSTAVTKTPTQREAAQQPVAAKHDAIGALLRGDVKPSTPTPPASIPNASSEQTRRITAVQEALKKLGHNVKPDGIAGPTTRVAIESFERQQKWQVTGQMSPKMIKELSARSGVKIP
jgi:hypothetical protein